MIPTPVDEATHLRDMRGGSQRGEGGRRAGIPRNGVNSDKGIFALETTSYWVAAPIASVGRQSIRKSSHSHGTTLRGYNFAGWLSLSA